MDKLTNKERKLLSKYLIMPFNKATMCKDSPLQGKGLRTKIWEIFGQDDKLLGEGTYGEVWRTTKNFAIKYAIKDFTTIKEITLMDYLNHSNLLCISGIFSLGSKYGSVFPFANKGTLDSLTNTLKRYPKMRKDAYYQIFCGLAYLHAGFLIHADIKPENILVFRQGWYTYNYKIADFGLTIPYSYVNVPRDPKIVTILWRAPELLEKTMMIKPGDLSAETTTITDKIDIWAMGIIIYDIIYQKTPEKPETPLYSIFEKGYEPNFDEKEIYNNILRTDFETKFMPGDPQFEQARLNGKTDLNNNEILRTEFKTKFLPGEQDLANSCLKIDPLKRPSAIECLNFPFFEYVLKVPDIQKIMFNSLSMPETDSLQDYEHRDELVKYVFNIIKKIYNKKEEYNVAVNVCFCAVSILDFLFSGDKVLNFNDLEERLKVYAAEKKRLKKKTSTINLSKETFLSELYMSVPDDASRVPTVLSTIEKYIDLQKTIDIIIKIAISFIDDVTFTKKNFEITIDEFFESILERLDNQLFFPTAIQLYYHIYSKEPDEKELDRLLNLLINSPYQETFIV